MARSDPHFRLRLPSDIKDQLRESAMRNRRSITGEILFHLSNALQGTVKAVAENSLQAGSATVPNETALQGGPITHG